MPFKSQAQRAKFHAMADRGEMSQATVDRWEKHTPKGKKLPKKVKQSHDLGALAALTAFGLKVAGEELRLQIPDRKWHGYDAASKAESERGHKKADEMMPPPAAQPEAGPAPGPEGYGDKRDADTLEGMLQELDTPGAPGDQKVHKDPLDRTVNWGAATNPEAGDAGTRAVDPQGPSVGTVF